jgi:ElaB/YqjD/DUF883 family membrane-anchored ribosome-binding protein
MNENFNNPSMPPDPAGPTSSTTSVSDTARAAWDTTRQRAGEALHSGETFVRENPGTSAMGIFGLGFFLGLLVGWCIAHEERNSYARFAKHWTDKLHFDWSVKSRPNPSSPSPVLSALQDPDHFVLESTAAARAQFDRCVGDATRYAREQPEKALGVAVLAGYVLRMLPVVGLIRLLFGLVLSLLKPALVLYAAAKCWQQFAPSTTDAAKTASRNPQA